MARSATKRMPRVLAQPEWDKDKPTRSWALACYEAALEIYVEDGDRTPIKQARDLFLGALSSGADQQTIFHAWIVLELGHGDIAAARACYEEWRSRAGGCRGDTDFWCGYIRFEIVHGTAARSRAVAEVAMAACPRNPVLIVLYAKLELRLGYDGRARHIVRRAREILTADVYPIDEDAAKWVADDVERYRRYLRDEAAKRPTIVDVFRYFCGGDSA